MWLIKGTPDLVQRPVIEPAVMWTWSLVLRRDEIRPVVLAAAEAGISRVEVREDKLMLTRRGDFILVGGKFPRLVADRVEQRLREIQELIKKL